ncbi:hypothetical protein TruAng_011911 [Truncatella angustata]|nr:hypothetical protein TruAng_011911 [Truncatella angustata]
MENSAPSSEKNKTNPPLDKSYKKVPQQDRWNLEITPLDPNFVLMERYFNRQLRDQHQDVTQILEDHFEASEIEQFVPTHKEPLSQWQEDNKSQFLKLLSTSFKDKIPSLPCKMTMLYFGLPVAPMKRAPLESQPPTDLSAREHEMQEDRYDPLSFLDEYAPQRTTQNEDGPQAIDDSLGLRGGALDENGTEMLLSDIDEEESSIQWEAHANSQLTTMPRGGVLSYDELPEHAHLIADELQNDTLAHKTSVHLYGRQGFTGTGPSWADFVRAVTWLLGKETELQSNPHAEVNLAIDLFEEKFGGKPSHLLSQEGTFYLDPERYNQHPDNELLDFVTKEMNLLHKTTADRFCFVRLARDKRPTTYRPDGHVPVVHLHRDDIAQRPTVYTRLTSAPTDQNVPSQYSTEFNRAVAQLLQTTSRHQYLNLSYGNIKNTSFQIYAGQEPPPDILDALTTNFEDTSRFGSIHIDLERVGQDHIPLLTERRIDGAVDDTGMALLLDKCMITQFHHIAQAICTYCIDGRYTASTVKSAELYLPYWGFLDQTVDPVVCHFENGFPVSNDGQWISRVNRFKSEKNGDVFNNGFAVWGRAVYSEYVLEVNDVDTAKHPSHTMKNLLDLDLASFKLTISTHLLPNKYDTYDRNMTLRLFTGDEDTFYYVIRFETTEQEWCRIRRSIASSKVRVEMPINNDFKYSYEEETRWDVDPDSYWGPCYDNLHGHNHVTAVESVQTGKILPISAYVPKVAKERSASGTTATAMREQALWKTPSTFANPFRPTIPVNAPPKEPMLRVGPRVPAITMGLRTPTEMANIEDEVHKLRGLILRRTRDCPYEDCGSVFEYDDCATLDLHLREEHTKLRCPFCHIKGDHSQATEGALYAIDQTSALKHLYQEHGEDIINQPDVAAANVGSNFIPKVVRDNTDRNEIVAGYKHCDRCGRDNTACHGTEDRENHAEKCLNGVSPDKRIYYCVCCATAYYENTTGCENVECIGKTGTVDTPPDICCRNCGLLWSGLAKDHIQQHKVVCKPLGGNEGDFCSFCGTRTAGMDHMQRASHAEHCQQRPRPNKRNCPHTNCGQQLRTPVEVVRHLKHAKDHDSTRCLWCEQDFPAEDHPWTDQVKAQHFAGHMGAHAQIPGLSTADVVDVEELKCPGFVDCGVVVSHMTDDQFVQHFLQAHNNMFQFHYPNGQLIPKTEISKISSTRMSQRATSSSPSYPSRGDLRAPGSNKGRRKEPTGSTQARDTLRTGRTPKDMGSASSFDSRLNNLSNIKPVEIPSDEDHDTGDGLGDVPVGGSGSKGKSKHRSFGATSPTFRRLSFKNEPEGEVEDQADQKDGVPENFSMLQLGMTALPPALKSPTEPNFSLKRSRTLSRDSIAGSKVNVPLPKRFKKYHSTSQESIPTMSMAGVDNSKGKVRATPKPRANRAPTPTSEPAPPATPNVTNITRKSARSPKPIKRLAYDGCEEGESDEEEAGDGATVAKPVKTRAKAAVKVPAKVPTKAAVKTPAKTPAKRGRKKASQDIETLPSMKIVPVVDNNATTTRQPRFK